MTQAKIEITRSDRTHHIINVLGLPGSGKTTLSKEIADLLGAVHINADWARRNITKHLGFSPEDRVEQARILGSLAGYTSLTSPFVVVDFVNPTAETRYDFWRAAVDQNYSIKVHQVWMDTLKEGRFEDTNKLFEPPSLNSAILPGPGVVGYVVRGWQTEDDLMDKAAEIVIDIKAKAGYKKFYIRYNTLSDGNSKHWRIIQADDMSERLVDGFRLKGDMYPASTIEHDVKKWNVWVEGYPEFIRHSNGTVIFELS